MTTKIIGEQQVQILSPSFSISPSNENYVLNISADGKNFSPLFAVSAGVTRLVSNVAPGSYYKLVGNESEVLINWQRMCVTEGGSGGSGTELQPITEFPMDPADGTVVAYNGSASASGVYQFDGTDWVPVGVDDLSDYYTSAQTESAITSKNYITSAYTGFTPIDDFNFISGRVQTNEEVVSEALNDLNDRIEEISGNTGGNTEDIELPIAAAINDLKGNIEARLDQQYYKKQEVNDIAARKMEAGQVNEQIVSYVDPAIEEVYDTIEDKELPVSAAINELNQKIGEISGGSGADMSAYWTSAQTESAISAATANMVQSTTIRNIVSTSQAGYDALPTKDANTFYVITGTTA